jgi:hypothetical protein
MVTNLTLKMKSKDISYVIHKLVADYWLLSKEAAQKVESILKTKGFMLNP